MGGFGGGHKLQNTLDPSQEAVGEKLVKKQTRLALIVWAFHPRRVQSTVSFLPVSKYPKPD